MSLDTLNDLFVEQLRDVLSAEQQLTKALPKMANNANSEMLAEALEMHLEETQTHVTRIEEILEMIGEKAKAKKCKGMEGLITEGQEAIKEDGNSAVLDAGIIAAAQRVEHYEIAAYGCLIRYAQILGHDGAARMLQTTLAEEKAADEKLTQISDAEVLSAAHAASEALR